MRTIKVYSREKKATVEGKEKLFYIHYASEPNKSNKDELVYFDIRETKKCQKKLPTYNAEIGFEVSESYFIVEKKKKDDKEFKRNVLYLDDFVIIKEIPKKITTDEDLPF